MASVTLAESAKLTQDMQLSGLIESVVATDDLFQVLPFEPIEGNSIMYQREANLGTVATVAVGEDIGPDVSTGNNQAERTAAKDAATFNQVNSSLTTIMGDAEVNQMIQHTRSNKTDQTGTQIASKAKSAGRKFSDMLINGVAGVNNQFAGLINLVPAAQKCPTATDGENISFKLLDQLIGKVKDKDKQTDYIMMPPRTVLSFLELLRGLGGAAINDVLTLANGRKVPQYRGVPIFENDWIPVDQVKGASPASATTIFAGSLDDGSGKVGISGLTAANANGLVAEEVGIHHTKDEKIWRVKWYVGLALYSELGVASANGILD